MVLNRKGRESFKPCFFCVQYTISLQHEATRSTVDTDPNHLNLLVQDKMVQGRQWVNNNKSASNTGAFSYILLFVGGLLDFVIAVPSRPPVTINILLGTTLSFLSKTSISLSFSLLFWLLGLSWSMTPSTS